MRKAEARTRLAELVLVRPSLSEIARQAGVSRAYISAVAAGRRRATPRVRAAAAVVLALPASYIFPEETA